MYEEFESLEVEEGIEEVSLSPSENTEEEPAEDFTEEIIIPEEIQIEEQAFFEDPVENMEVEEAYEEINADYESGPESDQSGPDGNTDNVANDEQIDNQEETNLYYEQVLAYLEEIPTVEDIEFLRGDIQTLSEKIEVCNNNIVQAESNMRTLTIINISMLVCILGAVAGSVLFIKIHP